MAKILALNNNYVPLKLISKYHCIGKMYTGGATALFIKDNNIEEINFEKWLEMSLQDIWPEDTKFIEAVSQRIAIPKVIKYSNYSKVPKITTRLTRKAIYNRDKNICYICGKEFGDNSLTLDHVIAKSKGGKESWENLVTCCKKCNEKKGSKSLQELGVKPYFIPYKPNFNNIDHIKQEASYYPKEWQLFGF